MPSTDNHLYQKNPIHNACPCWNEALILAGHIGTSDAFYVVIRIATIATWEHIVIVRSEERDMTCIPTNIAQFASIRETSNEVAVAIFEIGIGGDEHRLWADPTEQEQVAVTKRAFELAANDENELHWGCETLRRPGQ